MITAYYFRVDCLNTEVADTNYPSYVTDSIEQYLPGQVYDADDQCYIAFGTQACHPVCCRQLQITISILLALQVDSL